MACASLTSSFLFVLLAEVAETLPTTKMATSTQELWEYRVNTQQSLPCPHGWSDIPSKAECDAAMVALGKAAFQSGQHSWPADVTMCLVLSDTPDIMTFNTHPIGGTKGYKVCRRLLKTASGAQGADIPLSCDASRTIAIRRAYLSASCGTELAKDEHTSKAVEVCNGKAACALGYNSGGQNCTSCTNIGMSDPCPGTLKKIHVEYVCLEDLPSYADIGNGHCVDASNRRPAHCVGGWPESRQACEDICSSISKCDAYEWGQNWGGDVLCQLIYVDPNLTCPGGFGGFGGDGANAITQGNLHDTGGTCHKKVSTSNWTSSSGMTATTSTTTTTTKAAAATTSTTQAEISFEEQTTIEDNRAVEPNTTSSFRCSPGFAPVKGLAEPCEKCTAGHASDGSKSCDSCGVGYATYAGRSRCVPCRKDQVSGLYEDDCSACADGLEPDEDQSACVEGQLFGQDEGFVKEVVVPVICALIGLLASFFGCLWYFAGFRRSCKRVFGFYREEEGESKTAQQSVSGP